MKAIISILIVLCFFLQQLQAQDTTTVVTKTYTVTDVHYYYQDQGFPQQFFRWDESVSPAEDIFKVVHHPDSSVWQFYYHSQYNDTDTESIQFPYSCVDQINIFQVLPDEVVSNFPGLKYEVENDQWLFLTIDRRSIYFYLSSELGHILTQLTIDEVPSGEGGHLQKE
jgi:hypothetical protein